MRENTQRSRREAPQGGPTAADWRHAPVEADAWRMRPDGRAEWLRAVALNVTRITDRPGAGVTYESLGRAPAFGARAERLVTRY